MATHGPQSGMRYDITVSVTVSRVQGVIHDIAQERPWMTVHQKRGKYIVLFLAQVGHP